MYESSFLEKDVLAAWQGRKATVLPLREISGDSTLF